MQTMLTRGIRRELRDFVTAAGKKRALPPTCHVGHPGKDRVALPHVAPLEASLRADLVERVIDGLQETEGACGWVTRSGPLHLTDADVEWFVATRTGFSRHGLTLPGFFVLTRGGWLDLVSGERRELVRVRHARPAPAGR